jgi:leader peptidase (prepilin peptidase)/N-methyltransferase
MSAILIIWMLGALGIQFLLNFISRKINYSYGLKMEIMAIVLNLFVWGMVYYKFLSPIIEKGKGIPLTIIMFAVICSILMSIIFIDLKYYEIPNSYNAVIAILGIIFFFQVHGLWLNYLLGGVIAFALFFLIAIFTGGNLGMGDVKLAGGLGLLLGKVLLFQFFIVTFLSGAGISLILLAFRIKTTKDKIAFGPYICFAFMWMLLS